MSGPVTYPALVFSNAEFLTVGEHTPLTLAESLLLISLIGKVVHGKDLRVMHQVVPTEFGDMLMHGPYVWGSPGDEIVPALIVDMDP